MYVALSQHNFPIVFLPNNNSKAKHKTFSMMKTLPCHQNIFEMKNVTDLTAPFYFFAFFVIMIVV